MSTETIEQIPDQQPSEKIKSKRGRKLKYTTDEERKEARRKQQKEYRDRKRNELIELRRKAQQTETKNNE